METNITNQPSVNLDKLIGNLKKEDALFLKFSLSVQWLLWLVAAFYLAMVIFIFDFREPWYKPAGGLIVMLALVIFAVYIRNRYRSFKLIDYGLPTTEVLAKAVKRYQAYKWSDLLLIIPLILEDIGLCFFSFDFSGHSYILAHVIKWQVIFFVSLAIGFLIGYIVWWIRQKPLRDRALALIKEIES